MNDYSEKKIEKLIKPRKSHKKIIEKIDRKKNW
jgi:hypothetical protein